MAAPDETIRILPFLAQGFEDLEAIAGLDVFGWTQYREDIRKASVVTAGFHDVVRSRFGVEIRPGLLYSEIDPGSCHSLVLPGGFHSHGYDEAYDPGIHQLARAVHGNGGYIATMCVGILPIADAGLLNGKKATTYPYSRNHDNVGREGLRQRASTWSTGPSLSTIGSFHAKVRGHPSRWPSC